MQAKKMTLKIKVIILACSVIFLVLMVLLQLHTQKVQDRKAESYAAESERMAQEEKVTPDTLVAGDEDGGRRKEAYTNISNFDAYAAYAPGLKREVAEKKLYEFNFILGHDEIVSAKIIQYLKTDVLTEFYLENDDGSLLIMDYVPEKNSVQVSQCEFSKEQVMDNFCVIDQNPDQPFEVVVPEDDE